MGRVILLLVSATMLCAGSYLVWLPLKCMLGFTEGACWFVGPVTMVGAALIAWFGYVLWDDIFPNDDKQHRTYNNTYSGQAGAF